MRAHLLHLWKTNKPMLLGFAVAFALLTFFVVRSVTDLVYWADPLHRNQPLESWMTPRYVSHSYRLPPEILGPLLGIEMDPSQRLNRILTMERVADEKGMTLAELEALIRAEAIKFEQSRKPLPRDE